MPSRLRFKQNAPDKLGKTETYSRLPKSPAGAWTGEPVPAAKRKSLLRPGLICLVVCLLGFAYLTWSYNLRRTQVRTPGWQPWFRRPRHQCHGPACLVPDFRFSDALFDEDKDFLSLGRKGHRAWNSILPEGSGRIAAPGSRNLFQIAIYEQLDCLIFIRDVLVGYQRYEEPHKGDKERVWQCLNVVRQALTCAADTALEPVVETHGERSITAPSLHSCKNWTAVRGWMEEHKAG